MRPRIRYVALAAATLFGLLISSGPLALAQDGGAAILATYSLPDIPLAEAQAMALPAYPIADDRGFLLGGTGSDLWRAPDDPEGEFWMVSDRGPNGQIEVDGANRRTFPVPDFTPHILHVKTERDAVTVLEAIAIAGTETAEPATPAADASPVASVPVASVEISGFAYKPRQIEVAAGTEVVWENLDGSSHTVTAANFDSGQMARGGTFRQIFAEAGRYGYECFYHQNMTGVVIVT